MKKQGHHYITEGYQRLFADENGRVWVLTSEDKLFCTNPENVFKEDHFYTVKRPTGGGSLVVEDALAEIEGRFISTVTEKISRKSQLEIDDRIHIAAFLAAMLNRTKVQREHAREFFEEMDRDWGGPDAEASPASNIPSGGASITMAELKEGLKNFDSYQAMSTLSGVQHSTIPLASMEWIFLEAPAGSEYLSSNNPLCMCSPARELKFGAGTFGAAAGLKHEDVEVSFPISKRCALVATWISKGPEYAVATERMVEQINYRSARSANSLFAGNKSLLEDILLKSPQQ